MKPKFVISKSKVLRQYEQVKQISDFVSYSSKTNQEVTKLLEPITNCFFSVHFQNELKHIHDLSRVIFLAQAWQETEIQKLIDQKINTFIVDNESDLNTLLNYLEKHDHKINLFLRIKLQEHSIRTERYFVFGMSSEVVNQKIKTLSKHPKINQLGIHFHRKTQNLSEWNLIYDFQEIIEEHNFQYLDLVNIGGGLPSEYANTNTKVFSNIYDKIKEFRTWLNNQNIKLMIEPGRFIAAPSGKLITTIIGIDNYNIVINASVYNSDLDALVVPVKLKIENELKNGTPYVVKGITPCSMDLFRYRAYLDNPQVGDQLVFLNAGAYNFSSDFCDLTKLETEVVE